MSDGEIKPKLAPVEDIHKGIRKKQEKTKEDSANIPEHAFANFLYDDKNVAPVPLNLLLKQIEKEPTILKIGGDLFGKKNKKLIPIVKTTGLMTWLHGIEKTPYFRTAPGFVKEEQIYEAAIRHMDDDYEFLSETPIYPASNLIYMNCDYVEPGANGALDELLQLFNPATEYDAALLKSIFCTVAWSEGFGKKPFMLITVDQINTGKTTLLEKVASFFKGGTALSTKSEHSNRMKEILILRNNRVVYFDNVRVPNWSDPGLESVITSPFIQAHRLYHGAVQIPNIYTYMATLNDPNVSEDLASRSVPIKLESPRIKIEDWEEQVDKFLSDNRDRLFADIGALITAPRVNNFSTKTRFPLWEKTILQKHKVSTIEIADYIKASQNSINCENRDETEHNLHYNLSNSYKIYSQNSFERIVQEGGAEDYSWWIPTQLLYDLTTKERSIFNKRSGSDGRMLKKRLDRFEKWFVLPFQPYDGKVKLTRGYFFLSKSNKSAQAYRILPGSHAQDMRAQGLLISDAVWDLTPSQIG